MTMVNVKVAQPRELKRLITTMAILEERGELEKLDEIGLPPGSVIQLLFGLTSGFYFGDRETRQIRQPMLGLALRYYDLVEGNTNLLSFNAFQQENRLRNTCRRVNITTRGKRRVSI
ncbi:hypothetical protein [Agrobacterium radiobacter]|uniref:hypothetical protein n=1 Tax=Agrobacterium radiobacter TaxID=362 RepID=UPI003CE4C370